MFIKLQLLLAKWLILQQLLMPSSEQFLFAVRCYQTKYHKYTATFSGNNRNCSKKAATIAETETI